MHLDAGAFMTVLSANPLDFPSPVNRASRFSASTAMRGKRPLYQFPRTRSSRI
jgi:hypothetical protein